MASNSTIVLQDTGQPASNTANTAADPSIINEALATLNDPNIFILATGIITAILLLPFVGAYLYKKRHGADEFEKTKLSKIVVPSVSSVVDKLGTKIKTPLKRDHKTVGEAYRISRFTENGDLRNVFKKHQQLQLPAGADRAKDSDDVIDQLAADGVITDTEAEHLKDGGTASHWVFEVRPHKIVKKLGWAITDKLAGFNKFTDYYLVPDTQYRDNGKYLFINKDLQYREFGGVMVPLTFDGFSIINSVVMRHLYELALEDQANYHEQVNYYAAKFSQELQLEKERIKAKDRRTVEDIKKDMQG